MLKRSVDLGVTLLISPFVLTVIGLLALVLLVSNGLPIFFRQTRVGKNRKRFRIYKFRTMTSSIDTGDIPEDFNRQDLARLRKKYATTTDKDPRVTWLGSWLRKFSLDELPQIFNVIAGDMSYVGPRPDSPLQRSDYDEQDWFARHQVKPGITGLAQVNGRSALGAKERTRLDLEYAKNQTLRSDLSILGRTFLAVFYESRSN